MELFPVEQFQYKANLGLTKQLYNRGIRATTTADVLAHLQTLIFDLKPSQLVINIGSNDIGFGVPEQQFLANYAAILEQVHAQLPATQITVLAYYPVNTQVDFGGEKVEHDHLYARRSNATLTAANQKVATLAQQHHAVFYNANAGLTDTDGNLKADLTFDGAHLLPAGYEIVFQNLLPQLRS
jgi:lysophospholipase L1-like esterase